MIGAVGSTPRAIGAAPLAGAAPPLARAAELEPLLALLAAAARREDVVQLLGPSPAAALLDGLAEKARAVADLALQSAPSPSPVVVQATAARLPQAVAGVLADQLYAAASQPLPASLDASVRVMAAGSPLVAAYLERAARYLIVCRLMAAARGDLDALVGALKRAAATAEAVSGTREEADAPLLDAAPAAAPSAAPTAEPQSAAPPVLRLLAATSASGAEPASAAADGFVEARVDIATESVPPLALVGAEEPAIEAHGIPDGASGDFTPIALGATGTAEPEPEPEVAVEGEVEDAETTTAAGMIEDESEFQVEPAEDDADASDTPDGDAPESQQREPAMQPAAAPRWRALPQLVTASYHIVPVAVALEQLRDGAEWIAVPPFPDDPDVTFGDAGAVLTESDRAALRVLGDRTARSTPALTRAVGALRLPAPWSAEVLDALAPPASRLEDARVREQVRVLTALVLLRETQQGPAAAAPDTAPRALTLKEATAALVELAERPFAADVRAVLDAMAVDPAMRPTLGRAVRYVQATRELAELRDRNDAPRNADGTALPDTLDALLGDELPAVGAIDRAMLRALAAGPIAFKAVERATEARKRRGKRGAASEQPAAGGEEPLRAVVEGVSYRPRERSLMDRALARQPRAAETGDAAEPAPRDYTLELLAAAIVLVIWLVLG